MPELTSPLSVDLTNIPTALRQFPQWVCWKWTEREEGNGLTKPPYVANGHNPPRLANKKDPADWREFTQAALALSVPGNLFNGLGFCFTESDPFAGVDLDNCLDETEGLLPWALEIVERLNSYTEISPSGQGVKIFLRGRKPSQTHSRRNWETGEVEIYDRAWYFTLTGRHLAGTPTEPQERSKELEELFFRLWPEETEPSPTPQIASSSLDLDDQTLLELARNAANGAKFSALYDRGDLSVLTGEDTSSSGGDFVLCCLLAFWLNRDPSRIDRAFRNSALYREKWDAKNAGGTYGSRTIAAALKRQTETYTPPEERMDQTTEKRDTGPTTAHDAAVVIEEGDTPPEPSPVDLARQHLAACLDTITAEEVNTLFDDLALLSASELFTTRQALKKRLGRDVTWTLFDNAVEERRKALLPEREEEKQKDTQAGKLVDVALKVKKELFHTRKGDTYIILEEAERFPAYPVKSTDFRRWLRGTFFRQKASLPSTEAIKTAVETIDALAWQGPERKVYLRLAYHEGKVYVDLGNDQWNALEIDGAGWRVVNAPPVAFIRGRGALPLPLPQDGNLGALRAFVNVTEETWPLFLGFVLGCWGPGPYPVLSLTGEQGTGKTVAAKVIKALIDPNEAPTRKEPRESRDVMVSAVHSHLLAYDNLSGMPVWLSDLLCCITSGTGYSSRTLYADADETLLTARRPVVLNGIAESVQRSDLLDRSILLNLEVIPEDKRKSEAEFWADFEEALPGILGGLCTAVSTALHNLPHTHPERLPRMADFARWVIAGEPALGIKEGTFLQAYTENRGEAHSLALEGDIVARRLTNYLAKTPRWEGTSSELLDLLIPSVERKDLPKGTPTTARSISVHLKRIAPNLRANGIDVSGYRQGDNRTRIITLTLTDAKRTQNDLRTQTDANGGSFASVYEPSNDAEEEEFDPFTDDTDAK